MFHYVNHLIHQYVPLKKPVSTQYNSLLFRGGALYSIDIVHQSYKKQQQKSSWKAFTLYTSTLESSHHSPVQSWRGRALVWQPFHSLPTANNRQTKGPTRGDRREGECCVWSRMCMTQLCYWKCKVHRAACCKCELGLGPS